MATPRSQLIDSEVPAFYHLVSRCVRRAWLCGTDQTTGRNYDHRKAWLEERLLKLSRCFAVELFGYAIMSNHFHLIVRFDPQCAQTWSDDEVARRWASASSCRAVTTDEDQEAEQELLFEAIRSDPDRLRKARRTLGSLSFFMKHLKQPIAWRANREDDCRGHFFESRFYSGALLDDAALIAAMAYVDLNPVRAKLVRRAIEADHTSLNRRVQAAEHNQELLDEYLAPVISGTAVEGQPVTRVAITLAQYLETLLHAAPAPETDPQNRWQQRFALFKEQQRAYGRVDRLTEWAHLRGWSRAGLPIT